MGGSSWIWWLFLPVVGWLLFRQIRHMAQQHSSVRWPAVDAAIQKGPTGLVPVVGRGPTSACFIGYCFSVEGKRYTGLFALYGREDNVERVHKNFPSGSIRVRYNPADPSVSSLVDLRDPRFEDLEATQNPAHLVNAPLFDLKDAIGR